MLAVLCACAFVYAYIMYCFIQTTRGRESLQLLILQFNDCFLLSLLVGLVCSFEYSFHFSATQQLLCGYSGTTFQLLCSYCRYCRDSAGAVFYTNGRRRFCACEQNGGLMWAQPIRF